MKRPLGTDQTAGADPGFLDRGVNSYLKRGFDLFIVSIIYYFCFPDFSANSP